MKDCLKLLSKETIEKLGGEDQYRGLIGMVNELSSKDKRAVDYIFSKEIDTIVDAMDSVTLGEQYGIKLFAQFVDQRNDIIKQLSNQGYSADKAIKSANKIMEGGHLKEGFLTAKLDTTYNLNRGFGSSIGLESVSRSIEDRAMFQLTNGHSSINIERFRDGKFDDGILEYIFDFQRIKGKSSKEAHQILSRKHSPIVSSFAKRLIDINFDLSRQIEKQSSRAAQRIVYNPLRARASKFSDDGSNIFQNSEEFYNFVAPKIDLKEMGWESFSKEKVKNIINNIRRNENNFFNPYAAQKEVNIKSFSEVKPYEGSDLTVHDLRFKTFSDSLEFKKTIFPDQKVGAIFANQTNRSSSLIAQYEVFGPDPKTAIKILEDSVKDSLGITLFKDNSLRTMVGIDPPRSDAKQFKAFDTINSFGRIQSLGKVPIKYLPLDSAFAGFSNASLKSNPVMSTIPEVTRSTAAKIYGSFAEILGVNKDGTIKSIDRGIVFEDRIINDVRTLEGLSKGERFSAIQRMYEPHVYKKTGMTSITKASRESTAIRTHTILSDEISKASTLSSLPSGTRKNLISFGINDKNFNKLKRITSDGAQATLDRRLKLTEKLADIRFKNGALQDRINFTKDPESLYEAQRKLLKNEEYKKIESELSELDELDNILVRISKQIAEGASPAAGARQHAAYSISGDQGRISEKSVKFFTQFWPTIQRTYDEMLRRNLSRISDSPDMLSVKGYQKNLVGLAHTFSVFLAAGTMVETVSLNLEALIEGRLDKPQVPNLSDPKTFLRIVTMSGFMGVLMDQLVQKWLSPYHDIISPGASLQIVGSPLLSGARLGFAGAQELVTGERDEDMDKLKFDFFKGLRNVALPVYSHYIWRSPYLGTQQLEDMIAEYLFGEDTLNRNVKAREKRSERKREGAIEIE